MSITPPFKTPTLFVNLTDYTDMLVADSLKFQSALEQGTQATLEFTLKNVPGGFDVRGGQRIDLYLPTKTAPLFSGQITQVRANRYSSASWMYTVQASSWESVFYRRQLHTIIRNQTYESAVNQILNEQDQALPSVINRSVLNSNGVLNGSLDFYSINGAYPSDIFNFIGVLTNSIWRVIPGSSTLDFRLEFFDPFSTYNGFTLTQDNQSFDWRKFEPVWNLGSIVNTQTVRGTQEVGDTDEVAYFRGDGLTSKWELPTQPFNNESRVVMEDTFDAALINPTLWLESDTANDNVYADGQGFIQFEPTPAYSWSGIISTAVANRANNPTAVFDITWDSNGEALLGFTAKTGVSDNAPEFLEAGIYVDNNGIVYGVSDSNLVTPTLLTLQVSTQYRFRFTVKRAGGCRIEYQTGTDILSRNWTLLGEADNGSNAALTLAAYTYRGGFALASIKCTNPYLGLKLEVERNGSDGFKEELVGVYPIDDDLDAVIMENKTLAFFGSDPGPSTIPPEPTWSADPNYKNIRITYRRGNPVFATYRDSQSISDMAALFSGGDDGVREGPVIEDGTLASYAAAYARAKSEVDNQSNILESVKVETRINLIDDASLPVPVVGENTRFSITLPVTNYEIKRDIPIRRVAFQAMRGANDFVVVVEAGYLKRGIKTQLEALTKEGKVISLSENQVVYRSLSIVDSYTISDSVSTLGTNTLRKWGDSRLNRSFTVTDTTNDVITTSGGTALFETGYPVKVSSSGTLPSPLTNTTIYYTRKLSATTFSLHTTSAGASANTGRIDITNTGSGTHTLKTAGWPWGRHNWGSFGPPVWLRSRAIMACNAKTFKRVHLQGSGVLNAIGRVF